MTAPGVSRRRVLVGGAALAFLTACSSDDSGAADDADPDATTPGTSAETTSGTLLVLLPQQGVLTSEGPQRVPVAVAGPDGVPIREDLPTRTFQVLNTDSGRAVELEIEPHGDGVPTPYYPVIFTPESGGIHEVSVLGDEGFNLITLDLAETAVPTVGQPMPPLDTPTPTHDQGVTPICTRDPACELHEVSLRAALRTGSPIAFLVATPEFCQIAICGPVLDLLIEALPDYPTITGLHAEVYADPRGNADPTAGGLAPAAEDLNLPFEPTLFLIDATGAITARLDSVFDRQELRAALDQIA